MVFCKCAEGREVIEWEIIEIEELVKGTQKEEGTGRADPSSFALLICALVFADQIQKDLQNLIKRIDFLHGAPF